MSLQPGPYSRMQFTAPTIYNGTEVYGVWTRPTFLTNTLDPSQEITYTVYSDKAGKPHAIAYDVYGTQFLDWVVIAYNSPANILNWPKTGDVIRLPIKSIVIPEVT